METRTAKAYAASLLALLAMASLAYPLNFHAAWALSFYTPANLSDNDGDSSAQQVAASGSNAYVVWHDDTDSPSSYDILFSRSSDSGATFDSAVNLSANAGSSTDPLIVASGSNAYVVWHDDTDTGIIDVLFARSIDDGASFDVPVNLSGGIDTTSLVRMAISGDNIYVTWQQGSDIWFSFSSDVGVSFSAPVNLSNTANISTSHSIAASGDNVYVAWDENSDIFVIASTDGGASFEPVVPLSDNAGSSANAQMVASGSDLYVVWEDDTSTMSGSSDIFFSKSTDSGTNFSSGVPIANTDGSSTSPNMTLEGGNIYVVWKDEDTSFTPDVLFARSTDGGASFDTAIQIAENDGVSDNPKVAASGSNVYVVWDDDTDNPGMQDVFFSGSTDAGASFGPAINVSNSRPSFSPKLAASGNLLYITWLDLTSGFAPDVFVRLVEDTGPPSITIESVSNASPKWDLDSVQVSGTANADNTDTVTIDWGDGTSTPDVTISGSAWGPVSYTYDSDHTGENEIVARLVDQFDVERVASDPETVDVQKHETALTIDSIFSVIAGSNITAEGTLVDADTSDPLDGMTITFTGTGAGNLLDDITTAGEYSSTGASPGTAFALLTVQAHFAGDDAYEAADSDIISYDTVEFDAATFPVAAGAPSGPIELTGFGASILFDDVPLAGSIFVSSCDSPASARYDELDSDTCIQISPVVEMESDTAAHLIVSFAGTTLPDGYTEEDIGIFRESTDGITEITESMDIEEQEVTGETTGFSRFIVGVALHDPAPAGAKREQVFIGDNDISFDFTEEREISLSKSAIKIGTSATISVTDFLANLNSSVEETITATVTSTSDSTGITVDLDETGPDTSVFTGAFTLTKGDSSTPDAMLHAEKGDDVSASYEANTTAPFSVALTDVSEAGVAEVVSFDAPDSVIPVGDAYALDLVDAQLSPGSTITLTMSYANAELLDTDDPTQLRIVRVDGSVCEEVITPTLDTVEKTVTGTISALGEYTIAFPGGSAPNTCPGVPGGGGGGLPRPGSGLVLDAVAIVLSASSGGSSTTSSQSTMQSPSDSESVDVTVDAGGETVSVTFDTATGTESLDVETLEPSDMPDLFTNVDENQAHGLVGGSQFTTAGTMFEIDASNVDYDGSIEITIPYDESQVSNEDDVRFLHYGEDGWEDATVDIDTEENTVTGQVTSLSPVVAATVDDGTYGDVYFAAHPTKRISVIDAQVTDTLGDLALASAPQAPSQMSLQATVKNSQRASQTFAFIVQVLDKDGFTQSISWQTGELGTGESTIVSTSWAGETGAYKAVMFVWTDISTPWALSEAVTSDVVVA